MDFSDARAIGRAVPSVAAHLRAGGLIAGPTETVYGFACALQREALDALARLKHRDPSKSFLLLVLDSGQAPGLTWTEAARRLAAAFWPGPLTLALRAAPGVYPDAVVAHGSVAIRATPHAGMRALLREFAAPLTSTSANVPGSPPATDAEEVARVLHELEAPATMWLLDAGALPASPPSTIVDCAGERPHVVRTGAITPERLRAVLEEIDG